MGFPKILLFLVWTAQACRLAWIPDSEPKQNLKMFRLDYRDVPVRIDSLSCAQGQINLQFWEDKLWKSTLRIQSKPLRGVALLWQLPQNTGQLLPAKVGGRTPIWQWADLWMLPTSLAFIGEWKAKDWGSGSPLLQALWWGDSTIAEHWYWQPAPPNSTNPTWIQKQVPIAPNVKSLWIDNIPQAQWDQGLGSVPPQNQINTGFLYLWLKNSNKQKLPNKVQKALSLGLRDAIGFEDPNRSSTAPEWASRALLVWDEQGQWWFFQPHQSWTTGKCDHQEKGAY